MNREINFVKNIYKRNFRGVGRFAIANNSLNKIHVQMEHTYVCRESFLANVANLNPRSRYIILYRARGIKNAEKIVKFLKRVTKKWDKVPNLPVQNKDWIVMELTEFWTIARLGFLTVLIRASHINKGTTLQILKKSQYCINQNCLRGFNLFCKGHYNLSGPLSETRNIVNTLSHMTIDQIEKHMRK